MPEHASPIVPSSVSARREPCGGELAQSTAMRRLVLIGGGHAHLEVLRRLAARPPSRADVLLVSPYAHHHYSGMVPGYLQDTYAEQDLAFDLPALCRAAGARFREAAAECIDPGGRWVDVGGERIECDLVSADVGSAPGGIDDVPGAREYALTVRPMTRAVALKRRLDEIVADDASPRAVCVVGGGAGGVEVAFAVRRRLDEAERSAAVTLVDRAPALLGDYAPRARHLVDRLFAARGVGVVTGRAVTCVTADAVVLDSGDAVPSTLTIWLTGAAPTALTAASDLPKDDRGFWLVDETLRSVGGGAVWGGGDCVSIRAHPEVAKAGVYAVRQGPVLAANLRTALEAGVAARMRPYVPQPHFLAILNTADGRALLRWHGLTAHTRWAWWLKDTIDRRFMAKYQAKYQRAAVTSLPQVTPGPPSGRRLPEAAD